MNTSKIDARRFIDELVKRGFLNASLSETLAITDVLERLIGYRLEKAVESDRALSNLLNDLDEIIITKESESNKLTSGN